MSQTPELCVLCHQPIDPNDPNVIILTQGSQGKPRRLAHSPCDKKERKRASHEH